MMDGTVLRLGGKHLDADAFDLLALVTGSEGLLGVVTEVTVRILQKPSVARCLLVGFPSVKAGAHFVGAVIAQGRAQRIGHLRLTNEFVKVLGSVTTIKCNSHT